MRFFSWLLVCMHTGLELNLDFIGHHAQDDSEGSTVPANCVACRRAGIRWLTLDTHTCCGGKNLPDHSLSPQLSRADISWQKGQLSMKCSGAHTDPHLGSRLSSAPVSPLNQVGNIERLDRLLFSGSLEPFGLFNGYLFTPPLWPALPQDWEMHM